MPLNTFIRVYKDLDEVLRRRLPTERLLHTNKVVIYAVVQQLSQRGEFTVQDICRAVPVSQATVYRTVTLFLNYNIIKEVKKDRFKYEPTRENTQGHVNPS